MDSSIRTSIGTVASCGVAVWVGASLAQERYALASICVGLCTWTMLAMFRKPRLEAWLFGFLFFGYVVGNRGFAQIAPIGGVPLFLGELSLAIAFSLLLVRGAFDREIPFRPDALNWLLLLWLALGIGRMWWDVRAFGFVALRDFAMIYYLLFFFCAQSLVRHEPSRSVLRGALTATFLILPATAVLSEVFEDFFLYTFQLRGVPLVLQKGDLLAAGLLMGFFWLLPRRTGLHTSDWWRWAGAIANLVLGMAQLSRAGMVGLLVALCWFAVAGRLRPFAVVVSTCAALVLGMGSLALVQHRDFTQTKAYAVYEALVSIADFTGTRSYENRLTSNKGDNNRFRLVWWQSVIEDTIATNPLLGMGFGADIARGFVREYYAGEDLEFTARSPHNIFITTFGRMGAAGFATLLAIFLIQMRSTWRHSLRTKAATDNSDDETMTLHAICWVMMTSACFGVVLEGPMGAIPFWILLGMTHALGSPERPDTPAPTAPLPADPARV